MLTHLFNKLLLNLVIILDDESMTGISDFQIPKQKTLMIDHKLCFG